uniref:Zinc knuckle CX2CX4HX4C n=1 Tax=Tanacetum cinerariifolium TaxID=118510 RepID=A0A6L2KYR4_TANCI|nr:hypothetical protein [Tanacetum cinerariifolium]
MLKRLFSPPKLNLSNSGLEELQQPKVEGYGPKTSNSVSENIFNEVKKSLDAPLVKELVSDDKLEKKTVFPTVTKIEFVRPKQQENPIRKPVKYAEMERVVYGNSYARVNYNYSAKKETCHISQISRNSMEDMLPLRDEQMVAELMVKQNSMTATVRTVDNEEQEITATVDGKEFIITEASVRRHLQLVGADGISVLPITKFFDQFSLMGGHTLGSGEDSIELIKKLMETRTKLSNRVLDLEESKTAQDLVITRLRLRVKKLEKKKKKARTPQPLNRRLFKVRVESFATENLDKEDPSKQGRSMIEEIDQDARVSAQGEAHSQEDQPKDQLGVLSAAKVLADATIKMFRLILEEEGQLVVAVSSGSYRISTASRLFSTTEESVSTVGASMTVSTASMIQEVNISFPSPVAVKDKGKGKMEEYEHEQTKRTKLQQEQDRFGHEAAVRLQEELDEEERQMMARIHKLKKLSFDEIKKQFKTKMKIVNTFVPMETEVRGRASELAARSSQATITDSAEVGSSKRAAEAELDYEGSKRQKTNEASGPVQEQPDEEENELDDLMMLWSLVKERFNLTRYMHDPFTWRLYDTFGVHHVSTKKGMDIFMLVEKEYPLSKEVLTLMLVNKLSSFAKALIKIRAYVELKDTIVVARCACCKVFGHAQDECPKNINSGMAKNLKKPNQAPRGVPAGPKVGFKPAKQVYRVVPKKTNANTSGNKKKDVEPPKEESYENADYDYDTYGDDMYECQNVPDKIQSICDKLDIKVRGHKKN